MKLLVKLARRTRPSNPTLAELTESKKRGGLLRPEDDPVADFAREQARVPNWVEVVEEEGDDEELYDELMAQADKDIAQAEADAARATNSNKLNAENPGGPQQRELDYFGPRDDMEMNGNGADSQYKNGAGSEPYADDHDVDMENPLAGVGGWTEGSDVQIEEL